MFFHALTFARSRGSCLNTRPLGRVFKHRPRDTACVNAMKQTCVIVILACFTWFQHKPRQKRRLNIKLSLFLHLISQNKMASSSTFERHYVTTTSYIRMQRFRERKHRGKWSDTATAHSSVTSCMQIRAQFRLFQVNAMFKQHVNPMIWT